MMLVRTPPWQTKHSAVRGTLGQVTRRSRQNAYRAADSSTQPRQTVAYSRPVTHLWLALASRQDNVHCPRLVLLELAVLHPRIRRRLAQHHLQRRALSNPSRSTDNCPGRNCNVDLQSTTSEQPGKI